ncbi:MAG: hypothetical protein K9K88_00590 [Desulfobacterales bacterium]|nr:hypothetical protein [Desulfobacterales bacterium]
MPYIRNLGPQYPYGFWNRETRYTLIDQCDLRFETLEIEAATAGPLSILTELSYQAFASWEAVNNENESFCQASSNG